MLNLDQDLELNCYHCEVYVPRYSPCIAPSMHLHIILLIRLLNNQIPVIYVCYSNKPTINSGHLDFSNSYFCAT